METSETGITYTRLQIGKVFVDTFLLYIPFFYTPTPNESDEHKKKEKNEKGGEEGMGLLFINK